MSVLTRLAGCVLFLFALYFTFSGFPGVVHGNYWMSGLGVVLAMVAWQMMSHKSDVEKQKEAEAKHEREIAKQNREREKIVKKGQKALGRLARAVVECSSCGWQGSALRFTEENGCPNCRSDRYRRIG